MKKEMIKKLNKSKEDKAFEKLTHIKLTEKEASSLALFREGCTSACAQDLKMCL